MARDDFGDSVRLQQLLLSVTEELKLPLMQIARQAEQGQIDARFAGVTADTALRLLDNYTLGVRLAMEPRSLAVEAVSVSSVLYDAGQQLDGMAKSYGVELDISIQGRYGPVTANRQALLAALTSAGAALIEALPAAAEGSTQLRLQLAMHRSRYGLVAGLYTDTKQLSRRALKQGRSLSGSSRQPLRELTHASGAGIFVADAILRAMDMKLTVSRHQRLYGLGTILRPNPQLQLV